MEANSEFALLDLKETGRGIPERITERVPRGATGNCELRWIERNSWRHTSAVDPYEHRVRYSHGG
jgi:hypothetical protein